MSHLDLESLHIDLNAPFRDDFINASLFYWQVFFGPYSRENINCKGKHGAGAVLLCWKWLENQIPSKNYGLVSPFLMEKTH